MRRVNFVAKLGGFSVTGMTVFFPAIVGLMTLSLAILFFYCFFAARGRGNAVCLIFF